jgi:hypothetical protein
MALHHQSLLGEKFDHTHRPWCQNGIGPRHGRVDCATQDFLIGRVSASKKRGRKECVGRTAAHSPDGIASRNDHVDPGTGDD